MAVATQNGAWSAATFPFRVSIGGTTGAFQRVAGLARTTTVIQYRSGGDPSPAVAPPPAPPPQTATLFDGVFTSDAGFWSWYDQISTNTAAPQTVTITLLDGSGAPVTVWTLTGAVPTGATILQQAAAPGEVFLTRMVVTYETLAASQ